MRLKSFPGFLLLFFCGMIFFSSCVKKPVTIPKDVMSKEELVPVLVDIHLAQAVLNMSQLNDSSRYNIRDYLDFIFKSHHITQRSYDTSMAFYTLHPELLNEIYEEVISELSKRQSESERK